MSGLGIKGIPREITRVVGIAGTDRMLKGEEGNKQSISVRKCSDFLG